MAPEKMMAKLVEKKNLAGNFWSAKFDSTIEYKAGQYVSIKVNEDGERRSYSMASYPAEKGIELVADVTPMGKGSMAILNLNEGESLEILAPLGEFFVSEEHRDDSTKGFLFVGTGSGIVPLRSMVMDLLEGKKEKRPVRLHWGMRYEKNLFWVDEFKALEKKYSNFTLDIVLSKGTDEWMGCKGHVNDCLVSCMEPPLGWQIYVCGSKNMIMDVNDLLVGMGVVAESIHHEKFY